MSETLVEFIRARLLDDEQYAQSTMWDGSRNAPKWDLSASATVDTGGDEFYAGDRTVASHIVRHDPARVLREVVAKRKILDKCAPPLVEVTGPWDVERQFVPGEGAPWAESVLRELAATYSDHPDYQKSWAA